MIGQFYLKFFEQFLDTAGQKRYRIGITSFFKYIDCAIIMYDVTSLASFQQIPEHIQEFMKINIACNCPIFVVGNKIKDPNREVGEHMVAELCESFGDKCFYTFVDTKFDDEHVSGCIDLILAVILYGRIPNHDRSVKSARTETVLP